MANYGTLDFGKLSQLRFRIWVAFEFHVEWVLHVDDVESSGDAFGTLRQLEG